MNGASVSGFPKHSSLLRKKTESGPAGRFSIENHDFAVEKKNGGSFCINAPGIFWIFALKTFQFAHISARHHY
jgi:hypothetical protein